MKAFLIIIVIAFSAFTINKTQNPKLQASIKRGKTVYQDFCITCHMGNGEGVKRTFPPLAKSDYLLKNREASIKAIKYGMRGTVVVNGQTYKGIMTPLGLEDSEVADVMNYITNTWGNKNDSIVTTAEVSKIKK